LPLRLAPVGAITVGDAILIRPAAEIGPVPPDNLRFMVIRQDSPQPDRGEAELSRDRH